MNKAEKTTSSGTALAETSKPTFDEITTCRGCLQLSLKTVAELGMMPLANGLLKDETQFATEKRYPLNLLFCENCTLVQIKETVPPELLFSNYPYFSSFSDTMLESASALVDQVVAKEGLDQNSLVIEIGSNDGYLLKNYVAKGIPVLGIEPAENIASVANQRGVRTISKFFNVKLASELASDGKQCDIFHGNNVVAHIPDVKNNFLAIHTILKNDGIAIIEIPYIKPLLDHKEFDTIYHEHIFYFSLTALVNLATAAKLIVFDVEELNIHGGSLRVSLTKAREPKPSVEALLQKERDWGVGNIEPYQNLMLDIQLLKTTLVSKLEDLKSCGYSIAAYGASAKGTTFLNFFDIRDILDIVVDRSTVKQGWITPGTHLRIEAPSELIDRKIDYTLLLSWNFCAEIIEQQKAYLVGGGSFIVPLPELKLITWNTAKSSIQSTDLV